MVGRIGVGVGRIGVGVGRFKGVSVKVLLWG